MTGSSNAVKWLLALIVIGFLVYLPGFNIPYYSDDFLLVFPFHSSDPFYYFFHKNGLHSFYRPIETTYLSIVQHYFQGNTLPIHLVTLSMHIALAYLVYVSLFGLGFSALHAVMGSSFMLLSQASGHAILSNDTFSQVSGTLFGCISLWYLIGPEEIEPTAHRRRFRRRVISVFAFGIALLSKETSVAFFPILTGAAIAGQYFRSETGRDVKRILWQLLPFVIVLAAYFCLRIYIGASQPAFGPKRYHFTFGINVIENLAGLVLASIIPLSSVTLFTAWRNAQYASLAIFALATLLFAMLVTYGLSRSGRRGTILPIVGFVLIACFPMALMNQVSELYAYNILPFVSILVGIALGTICHMSAQKSKAMRMIILSTICLLAVSHITAVRSKALLMKSNGDRASSLLIQITPYARKLPPNGRLLLLNPSNPPAEYSIFLMEGFNVLTYSQPEIRKAANRKDITVKIIAERDLQEARTETNSIVLTIDQSGIKRVF